MLLLSRYPGEAIEVGSDPEEPLEQQRLFWRGDDGKLRPVQLRCTVMGVNGNQVRLGVEAPRQIPVNRPDRIRRTRRARADRRDEHGDVDGNFDPDAQPEELVLEVAEEAPGAGYRPNEGTLRLPPRRP